MQNTKKSVFFEISIMLLSALIIFLPIYYYEIYISKLSDFGAHLGWAESIFSAPTNVPMFVTAHAGWHWAVNLTHLVIGHSWIIASLIVTMLSVLATVCITFLMLRKNLSPFLSGLLAIGLSLVEPILLLYPFDHLGYIGGYIWPNIYHNPTFLFLRPFAVWQLFYAIEAFQTKDSSWKRIILAALVSVAAVFAKPNYIICLLPALGLIALIRLIKHQQINWKLLLIGIVLPSLSLLIWQYLLTFSPNAESSIVFAPFVVMKIYSPKNLLLKFILSTAFPITVTLFYWKEICTDVRMQIGLFGFGMGAIYSYFIAETGSMFGYGNFVFSGEISLFILFVCCVLFLAEKKLPTNIIKKSIILTTGCLHVLFGVINYCFIIFSK
jgi:hypothetical protein